MLHAVCSHLFAQQSSGAVSNGPLRPTFTVIAMTVRVGTRAEPTPRLRFPLSRQPPTDLGASSRGPFSTSEV